MNITSISRSILEPFTSDGGTPSVPGNDFVPSQPGQPPGMNLFAPDEPPAFLDIGKVKIVFGCSGSAYESTCDSASNPGGTTTLTFTDTALPCSPADGDPVNKEALDNLTCFWSFEFLLWFKIQFDYVFAGVCAIKPNGFIDELEIDYTPDMVSTRIRSGPWNGFPTTLGHEDPDCLGTTLTGDPLLAIVTTEISASPGGTLFGSGKAQLYNPGRGGADPIGQPTTIKNWFPTKITINSHILVGKIGCQLFVISAAC